MGTQPAVLRRAKPYPATVQNHRRTPSRVNAKWFHGAVQGSSKTDS